MTKLKKVLQVFLDLIAMVLGLCTFFLIISLVGYLCLFSGMSLAGFIFDKNSSFFGIFFGICFLFLAGFIWLKISIYIDKRNDQLNS